MSRVRAIELFLVELPLLRPFRTSFGETTVKRCLLARVETDVAAGWGECVADDTPGFSSEFTEGALLAIRSFLAPALFGAEPAVLEDLDRVDALFSEVRGHPMAKATLVDAVVDAGLRARGVSLASFLGAERDRVECGISVGIQPSAGALVEQVDAYVREGYRRIKLKIAPGLDVDRVAEIRGHHPGVPLSVDANAAYALADVDVFRALDELRLVMIEQPLRYDDLVEHTKLQAAISTDLCLDESIGSAAIAKAALELGACRIVNIKQGRVGGVLEARRVHDVCGTVGAPVWCGGMLETGVGRATNLALAAMPGFTLPGDTSPSSRYFAEDLTPPFEMEPDGTMGVPSGPGIGVDPLPDRLKAVTVRRETLRP